MNSFDSQPNNRRRTVTTALCVLFVIFVGLGCAIGSSGFEITPATLHDPSGLQIIWDIRLPRTLGAWLAGALLGLSGALAQGLFRNPLADPYLLGSASGASLGVAFIMTAFGSALDGSSWLFKLGLSGAAFLGAILAVSLTIILSRGVQQTMRLLLAGIIVGVILGAITSLITLMDPKIIQTMQSFLLGTTSFMNWNSIVLMGSIWLICASLSWFLSKALDALSLGESTATSLGVHLPPLRASLIFVLALAIGAAVAQTGLIAFVGLASPHLIRSLLRVTHNWLILLSSLAGGLLLVVADLGARWLIAPEELPVGILTAVLGGTYLLWLMYSQNVNQEAL